jgi:hypothetical protein
MAIKPKFILFILLLPFPIFASPGPGADFKITTGEGEVIHMIREPLDSVETRPIQKTMERLNEKFNKPDFFIPYRLDVKPNTELTAEYKLKADLRISVFEIIKSKPGERIVRLNATSFFKADDVAIFKANSHNYEEQAFFVFAEASSNKEELTPIISKIMREETKLLLKDYGTNWSLSTVEFTLQKTPVIGESKKKEKEFTIEFDEIINVLEKPQWSFGVRITTE